LEAAHVPARVDHRTLAAQGIDREPQPAIPRAAYEMERQGYRSFVAERLRAEHQARVDSRLQRAAQQSAGAEPSNVTESKNPEDIRKQAIENWLRYREASERGAPQAEAQTVTSTTAARKNDHSL
jgi:hypothetical protein